jgi:hypothetical protein
MGGTLLRVLSNDLLCAAPSIKRRMAKEEPNAQDDTRSEELFAKFNRGGEFAFGNYSCVALR